MRNRSKLLLTGLCASIVLASAVSTASANRLSVNETGFRITWSALTFDAAGNTVACPVSLGGSFHSRTISKVARSLVGRVNAAAINGACAGGTATILRESLPWHVQYGGFTGTLPRIATVAIRLVGAQFRVFPTSAGVACLARTTEANPGVGTITIDGNGQARELSAGGTIPLEGGFFCAIAGNSSFSGIATVRTLAGALFFIRLI